MRITVTVVVIMFELTGALTYILPTMVGRHPPLSLSELTLVADCIAGDEGSWRPPGSHRHCGRDDPL